MLYKSIIPIVIDRGTLRCCNGRGLGGGVAGAPTNELNKKYCQHIGNFNFCYK